MSECNTKQDVGSSRCLSMSKDHQVLDPLPGASGGLLMTSKFNLTPRDRNVCGHQNFGIPFFQGLETSLKKQWLKREELDANRIDNGA